MEITIEKINTRADPYQLFLDSIRNESTKRRYKNLLGMFLKLIPNQLYSEHLGKIPKNRDAKALAAFFVDLARKNVDLASDVIAAYIKEDKKRVDEGDLSSQTLPNHIKPIRALLDANRIPLHWKSLNRLMPRRESKSQDRASHKIPWWLKFHWNLQEENNELSKMWQFKDKFFFEIKFQRDDSSQRMR